MALYRSCLVGKIATVWAVCVSYTSLHVYGSRMSQALSMDSLQPDVQAESNGGHNRQSRCASGNCLKQRRSNEDGLFLNYITNFAQSKHGQLLDDIIRLQLAQPDEIREYSFLEKKPASMIIGILDLGRFMFGYVSSVVNTVFLFLTSSCFIYIAILYPLSNYFISAVTTHIVCSIFLGLTHDLMPPLVLLAISLSAEAIICVFLQYLNTEKRRRLSIYFACTVKAKLLHDFVAVMPYDLISPSFTGIPGVISIKLLRTSNFMVVRMVYVIMLLGMGAFIFRKLPAYVRDRPEEIHEVEKASAIMRKMIYMVVSWPIAALIVQPICSLRKINNPLGPNVFFFTPTQFRIYTAETWSSLIVWALTGVALFEYSKTLNKDHPGNSLSDYSWLGSSSSEKAS